jgi:hypothetical protein
MVGQKIYLPTSKKMLHTGRTKLGTGMGSVLLDGGMGGAGGGSSYDSISDYIDTTHQNPYLSQPRSISGGSIAKRGLASMNKKIEGLLVKKGKEKNINFNI